MTEPITPGQPRPARRRPMRTLGRALRPVIAVVAVIYFLIDAIFIAALRPIGRAIARLGLFDRLDAWIQTLHPYVALALFVVPLAVLEPVKPIGLYLMASGHAVNGVLLIVAGEIIKITLVERLFHIAKDKLMTIPAFAWTYNLVTLWLAYLRSTAAWQAVARRVGAIRQRARRMAQSLKRLLRA